MVFLLVRSLSRVQETGKLDCFYATVARLTIALQNGGLAFMSAPDVTDLDFASAPPPRAPGGVNPRERGRRAHAHDHVGEACANCGTILLGPHCHVCGQPAHIHRSLGHALEEFLHGLLHLDGRTWRTLPKLFFRPGTLTRQYITGKRADHVPPLALFLLSVFVMFLAFAFVQPPDTGPAQSAATRAEQLADARTEIADLDKQIAAARQALARAEAANPRDSDAIIDAKAELAALETSRKALGAVERGLAVSVEVESPQASTLPGAAANALKQGDVSISTGFPAIDKKITEKLKNPDLFIYKLQSTAYKFAFLLVPLTLPFLWLLFAWKKDVTLFDHVVFSLYSLSFVTILATVEVVTAQLAPPVSDAVGGWLLAGMPAHMFFQLKGGYALGWFSAAWRLIALLLCLTVVIGLFVLAIIALGALG
jgi:hypothetical protein